jgi:hypothetical protein
MLQTAEKPLDLKYEVEHGLGDLKHLTQLLWDHLIEFDKDDIWDKLNAGLPLLEVIRDKAAALDALYQARFAELQPKA